MISGSFDTLREYGTHGKSANGDGYAAIIYIDSPLLLGCDLMDFPGYGHSKGDERKAEFAHRLADILIYVSQAQGFLNERDLLYISQLLKQVPPIESSGSALAPLSNIFFVASVARMPKRDIEEILSLASARAYKHLKEGLEIRAEITGQTINESDFSQRVCPYLVEDQD